MTSAHWTTANIPDQSGRVVVVTGSNTGLGLETARALAAAGADVVMAVRSLDKGESARAEVLRAHPGAAIHLQALDLTSLDSVRTAADEIRAHHNHLDLLVNNAGVMYTEWQTTSDGFEFQMGVNHLGHFALTMLLLDHLLETSGSRVVNVSSVGHKFRSTLDPATMMSGEKYDRIAAYGRSKLANLLFTYELQRRLDGTGTTTTALVAHPGGLSDRTGPQRSARVAATGASQWTIPAVRSQRCAAAVACGHGPPGARWRVLRSGRLPGRACPPCRRDVVVALTRHRTPASALGRIGASDRRDVADLTAGATEPRGHPRGSVRKLMIRFGW